MNSSPSNPSEERKSELTRLEKVEAISSDILVDGSPTTGAGRMQPEHSYPSHVRTASGTKFYLDDPRKTKEIKLIDLLIPIARICRYNFHLNQHYSVAEHCYHVSFRTRSPLHGLLHDLSESIIGDLPAPVKRMCPDYKNIEVKVEAWIYHVFGVGPPPDDLKKVDLRMLTTEQMYFCRAADYLEQFPPYSDVRIACWEPVYAALKYLERLQELLDVQLRLDDTLKWESPLCGRRGDNRVNTGYA
jgi:hypothetical protein